MSTLRFIGLTLWVAALGLGTSPASGQDYPNKPIRIVSSQIGSSTDFLARLIAQSITAPLGQQVIIDNRVSVIRGQIVAKALPDGYTLLIAGAGLWVGPLMQETPYDAVKDFAPITITDRSPSVVVVHPSVPAKSVREIVALAKARPGQLNWSSGPNGGPAHLAGELFVAMAGIKVLRVSYKSIGVGLADVLSGDLQMAIPSPGLATPHMNMRWGMLPSTPV